MYEVGRAGWTGASVSSSNERSCDDKGYFGFGKEYLYIDTLVFFIR